MKNKLQRYCRLLALMIVLPVVNALSRPPATDPLHKYLFIDDANIAHTYQVVREVIQPQRHPLNPLIVADKPWEGHNIYVYGTVLLDKGRYRVWYQVFRPEERQDRRFRTSVGYAESADGLNWRKPILDVIQYKGQWTNLVLLNHGTSDLASLAVVKTPDDPDPQKRYKMLYWDSMSEADLEHYGANFPLGKSVPGWRAIPGEGFFIAYSPDGIHWTNPRPQPVATCACDALSMTRSPDGLYRAFFKISVARDRHFRVLGLAESHDFETWSEPRVILQPDWHDPYGTEFYGMSAFDYFGNSLGLIWMYHNSPDDKHMDIQLATERDGQWHRAADRRTFLGVGKRGAWDAGKIMTVASNVLVSPPGHPDEIWLYYGGSNVRHDDHRFRQAGIGLVTFRMDGFVAMRAGMFDGLLETRPISINARNMWINLAARHGYCQVELLDPQSGKVLAKSKVMEKVNRTRLRVPWPERGAWPIGQKLVVRFRMREAHLFAFWFEH